MTEYDFSRCKLCAEYAAAPKYQLKQMTLYACGNCDFHYIDALDTYVDEAVEGPLLTAKARRFIEQQLPQNRVQLEQHLRFVESVTAVAGKRCLDIGTGVGVFPALLKDADAEPQAIEPQQIFREYAQEVFGVTSRPERVDDPYWQEQFAETFDLVTLWDTLEHVNFPADTVRAASRLLKAGGYLFLDTPSRDSFFYRSSEWSYRFSRGTRALLLNTFYSPKPFRHKQIFTKQQLWWLLEGCGLRVVGQSPYYNKKKKFVVVARKEEVSCIVSRPGPGWF